MIITIKKDDETVTSWDTNNISDDNIKMDANVIIRKVEILGVVAEGLQFSSDTFRNNLTTLLQGRDEAIVDLPPSMVETPTEDGGPTTVSSDEGMTEDDSSTKKKKS